MSEQQYEDLIERFDSLLEAQGAILLTLCRIYDTQMLLVHQNNAVEERSLREVHAQGDLVSPLPFLIEGDIDGSDSTEQ
jgi:hypothetical protein